MEYLDRAAVTLVAKPDFLDWLKEKNPRLQSWSLGVVNSILDVYLFEGEDPNMAGEFLRDHHREVLEVELNKFPVDKNLLPKVLDLRLFDKWFSTIYHESVCDLSSSPIEKFED